jgi:hypothetical protein
LGLFIVGILAIFAGMAAFLPTSYEGATCGNFVSPEWTRAKSEALAKDWISLGAQRGAFLGDDGGAYAQAKRVALNYSHCDEKLDTRRNITIGLGVAALIALLSLLVFPDNRAINSRVQAQLDELPDETLDQAAAPPPDRQCRAVVGDKTARRLSRASRTLFSLPRSRAVSAA